MKRKYLFTILYAVISLLFVSCEKVDLQNEEDEKKIEEKIDEKDDKPDGDKPQDESVSSFPKEADVWNGHVVAYTEPIRDDKCECLLISLDAWRDVWSANNKSNPTMAKEIADGYVEGDLDDWAIPTLEQATKLKEIYKEDENFNKLNAQFVAQEGKELLKRDEGSKNARYLCDRGYTAFSYVSTSPTQASGATVKYRLKLVKSITISKK